MLKSVRLKNFIHFKREQNLDFEEGSYFFIGPNNSGKSSVFEAIRRCLSIFKNTSLSSSYDRTAESVVICTFDGIQEKSNDDEPQAAHEENTTVHSGNETEKLAMDYRGQKMQDKQVYPTTSLGDQRADKTEQPEVPYITQAKLQGRLLSSIVCLPQENTGDISDFVKTVIYLGRNGLQFGLDFMKENKQKIVVNERIILPDSSKPDSELYEVLMSLLVRTNSDDFVERFVKKYLYENKGFIDKLSRFACYDVEVDEDSPCNTILRDNLDGNVVSTFPMRSIGPLQGSRSKRVSNEFKGENYRYAQEIAEIITWYISWCKENKNKNADVLEREKRYFGRITDHSEYDFKHDAKARIVVSSINTEKALPLLKVPEDILEAKCCAILLAVDCFSTIGLEDPERGMHPQMVERLRDLVLLEVKNKVVIVTHHPSFIAPWTVPRLFFFRHCKENNTSDIIPGTKLNTDHENLHIITSYNFSTIFFAKSKRKSDWLFMSALRLILIKDKFYSSVLVNRENKEEKLEIFLRFLSTLQIIEIAGAYEFPRFCNLCRALDIECYCLIDLDVFSTTKKCLTYLKSCHLDHTEANVDSVINDVSLVAKDGLFVWKDGTINDVFINFSNDHDSLIHTNNMCITNNVHTCVRQCFVENHVYVTDVSKVNQVIRKIVIKKLLTGDRVTEENIQNIVKKVLDIQKAESEFNRFVNFLFEGAMQSCNRLEETGVPDKVYPIR